jgi:hypothetical protein
MSCAAFADRTPWRAEWMGFVTRTLGALPPGRLRVGENALLAGAA